MKGRIKDRIKISLVIGLSVIASVIIISLVAGRLNTVSIVVVTKDGLDLSLPLDEQQEFFKKEEILKSEMEYFQGAVVTDFEELIDKKSIVKLNAGSPILRSSLYDKDGGGEFALAYPKGYTVKMIPNGAIGLPPLSIGDKINIGLTYKKEKVDEETGERKEYNVSTIVFENLEIINLIESEGHIYLKVTIEEDVFLQVLNSMGELYVQLPGQSEEGQIVNEGESSISVTSEELFQKIQNGEILNTNKNIEDILEKGRKDAAEGNLVQPKDDEEKDAGKDGEETEENEDENSSQNGEEGDLGTHTDEKQTGQSEGDEIE